MVLDFDFVQYRPKIMHAQEPPFYVDQHAGNFLNLVSAKNFFADRS